MLFLLKLLPFGLVEVELTICSASAHPLVPVRSHIAGLSHIDDRLRFLPAGSHFSDIFCQYDYSDGLVLSVASDSHSNIFVLGIKKHPSSFPGRQFIINQEVGGRFFTRLCPECNKLTNAAIDFTLICDSFIDELRMFVICASIDTFLFCYLLSHPT